MLEALCVSNKLGVYVFKYLLIILFSVSSMISIAEGKPDFSDITKEKAIELEKEGKLFKILLFPAEFGGKDEPNNQVYVPAGVPEMKDQFTGTFINFYQKGLINKLTVSPEYKGESVVPSKIKFKAWHSEKEGGISPEIEIW